MQSMDRWVCGHSRTASEASLNLSPVKMTIPLAVQVRFGCGWWAGLLGEPMAACVE